MSEWLDQIREHSWGKGVIWAGAAVLLFVVLNTVRFFVRKQTIFPKLRSTLPGQTIARLAKRTNPLIILVFSFWATSSLVELRENVDARLHKTMIVALGIQLILWAGVWMDLVIDRLLIPRIHDGTEMATARMSKFALNVLTFTAIVIFTLDNVGINVTTLVAGLGVGGVAVALAVQNILGDLFSSLTIILDKPFAVGDSITVGTESGTVEAIGLKTTRVRSLGGEQLIFSNSDLLQSRVRNFRRMERRRVLFTFGVTYDTPRTNLEQIPVWLKEFVDSETDTSFERCHLKAFGQSSLDFECVYWITTSDYARYMDAHQAICLKMLDRFQKSGVEFAFPTQVSVVKGTNSEVSPVSPRAN